MRYYPFEANAMKCGFALISLFVVVLSGQAVGQSPLGDPLGGLERIKDFQTMRASSCDPNWKSGNADARGIEPGATLIVAELDGPGKITHIWCTIAHRAPFYSRLLTLRIYWDGEEHPTVKVTPQRWGTHKLAAGKHVIRFECVGKSDKSDGYLFGFDTLTARIPAHQRPAGFDLRKVKAGR